MSTIKEAMLNDIKEAMREGNKEKRDALRVLMSALKQKEVDERKVLSDEDVIGILKKAYKQREEAALQYKEANRNDLLSQEQFEMNLIASYLPKQLSNEALKQEIIAIIAAHETKEMGQIMKLAMAQLGAVADGKRISQFVKEQLQSK